MRLVLLFFLVCFSHLAWAESSAVAANPSPYVAMHADDKVQWRVWGAEAIAEAKRTHKPILLAIGYFSCYWCHVMQKENYNHDKVAAFINQSYIPIVVDREMNPALDARMIAFVEKVSGHSGWPLHVILTSEGYPMLGVVYLPQPRFMQWLQQASDLWKTDKEYLKQAAEDAALTMGGAFSLRASPLTPQMLAESEKALLREVEAQADELAGGFGQQAKFPLTPILQALVQYQAHSPDPYLKTFLPITLDGIAKGGLHDQLLNGFFRYTTDPAWQLPHFEKMLYDNALLASLYFRAADVLKLPKYRRVGSETLDFMLAEMHDASGAFVSSISAVDHLGEEGGSYFLTHADLQGNLTDAEIKWLTPRWQLSEPPPFEQGYLPTMLAPLATEADELIWATIKRKLIKLRRARGLPVDEKHIASWNALALSSLIDGAISTGEARYAEAADKLAELFLEGYWGKSEIIRVKFQGASSGRGELEDYAYASAALLKWAEWRKNPQAVERAKAWVALAWPRYFSSTGWRLSDEDVIPYGTQEAMLTDGPLPSAAALLIGTTLRLKSEHKAKVDEVLLYKALGAGHAVLRRNPFWYANQLHQVRIAQQTKP